MQYPNEVVQHRHAFALHEHIAGFRTARALCPAPPEAFGQDPDRAAVDDENPRLDGAPDHDGPIVVNSDGLVDAVYEGLAGANCCVSLTVKQRPARPASGLRRCLWCGETAQAGGSQDRVSV
jgi:hypothetical protein